MRSKEELDAALRLIEREWDPRDEMIVGVDAALRWAMGEHNEISALLNDLEHVERIETDRLKARSN